MDKHNELHKTTARLGTERLSKLLLRLSTPSMISMAAMSLYILADTFWLGRVSYEAVAAITITFPFYGMIFAIALGSGIGANALASRRFGERNIEATNHVVGQIFPLTAIFGVIFIIPSVFFSKQLATLLGAPPQIVDLAAEYLIYFGWGIPFILFRVMARNVFHASGDTVKPMIFIVVGSVLNAVLDPFLIFGWDPFPEMGIGGAALATTIAGGLTAAIGGYYLVCRRRPEGRPQRRRRKASMSCSPRSRSIRTSCSRRCCCVRRTPHRSASWPAWLKQMTSAKGSALQEAAQKAGFEPSFVALSLFPQVVEFMATDLAWTTQLGQVFSADRGAVFASIQRLRVQSKAVGNLKSTPQQSVETRTPESGQQVIVIEPANPQVVYVPQYNPQIVYTQPATSTTVIVQEEDHDNAAVAGVVGFAAGSKVGSIADRARSRRLEVVSARPKVGCTSFGVDSFAARFRSESKWIRAGREKSQAAGGHESTHLRSELRRPHSPGWSRRGGLQERQNEYVHERSDLGFTRLVAPRVSANPPSGARTRR